MSEKCKVEFVHLWPHSGPPPQPPLTCIVFRAEDQAPGEEENLWQGSPRSLFSPVPSLQETLTSTSCPAPHPPSLAVAMWERWMNNQEENIFVIPSSVLILNMYSSLSLKAHLELVKTKNA